MLQIPHPGSGLGAESVFQPAGHDKRDRCAYHDPYKKQAVAEEFLNPSGHHAGNHHAQRHESRTDGIMGGLVLSFREMDEIKHIGCKAESVSELFDKDTAVYQEQVCGLGIAEIYIYGIRQGDCPDHGPEPPLQAVFGYGHSSQDSSYSQADYAYGSLCEANLCGCHAQASLSDRVKQKGDAHFPQLCFWQPVKQHEENGCACTFFLEK